MTEAAKEWIKECKKLQDKNWKLEEQITKWKEDYIALENLKDNELAEAIEIIKIYYHLQNVRLYLPPSLMQKKLNELSNF